MNWLYSIIVLQCTIGVLHGRPDGTSTIATPNDKVSLEMEHPASVAAIVASLEPGSPYHHGIVETTKHLTANVAIAPPSQMIKRVLTPAVTKKKEQAKEVTGTTLASTTTKAATAATTTTTTTTTTAAKTPKSTAATSTTTTTTTKATTTAAKLTPKPTTRINDEPATKQKPLTTTVTRATQPPSKSSSTTIAEKPTIYDIISETEKNQTLMQQQLNRASTPLTPLAPVALPLLAQPLIKQHSDSPKAINHAGIHHGHPGVAEPLTWQQLESEMGIVDQNLKETSTSKDGISTWILLSGSEKQQPSATPATTTTVAHVDKLNVKDSLTDRHNYRFQQIHTEKVSKPIKTPNINKRPKPDRKKGTATSAESTTVTKTTPMPSPTMSGILVASDFTTESKNRHKPLVASNHLFTLNNQLNKKKLTTTTTTTTTEAPISSTELVDEEHTLIDRIDIVDESSVDDTTPVSFIVLEPKDADFDLPQDRSPATKKPLKTTNKTKRKPPKKNKIHSTAIKAPSKVKDKPITSTIYSYLSREVMPTVGVGLMGLVLTAGIAGYLFGPLGALRRSYDEAADRQDNVDSIYSVNNEEYASEGTDNGQNEEEIFGKFLAGMPASYVPRYVKYFRPDGNQHQNQPTNYPFRRVSQPHPQPQSQSQPQAQASNMVPKYSPYMRYRAAPSPHYNTAQYNPHHQMNNSPYRNHHVNAQPVHQPVYNPQYQEMQKQKSFANNIDTILKHQTTIYGKKGDYANMNTNVAQEKSSSVEMKAIEPDEEIQETPADFYQSTEVIQGDQSTDEISSKIQRRTYVVGSSITDTQPAEAIVSASMTASIDGMPAKKETNEPVIITPVTVASHGPRRKRRDTKSTTHIDLVSQETTPAQQTTKSDQTSSSSSSTTSTMTTTTTTSKPSQTTRLYSLTELASLESEYNLLQEKIMSFDREYSSADNEKKVEKKIQIEFNSIKSDYDALKKAIDGAKAIEQFQKQIHIRPKNFELSVVLKTGITGIRQRIRYLNDLVEHPDDDRHFDKINRRDGNGNHQTDDESTTVHGTGNSNGPQIENGFVGFLKLLQLKAQFGLNLLQNIRPSFERAFEEVFKRPYEKQN